MLRLNLTPSFLLARATMPRLLESRGAFVAVSSSAVRKPFAGAAGYLTAKAALITLIEALDAEYGTKGVRANVLLPGTLDTPANRAAMPDAKTSTWVTADQLADAVSLLLSPGSSAIRGAAIPLAGAS
jgi:NAD(P)-dependent dehydrogenase (short-subunit alcohol dehydrogenase family)